MAPSGISRPGLGGYFVDDRPCWCLKVSLPELSKTVLLESARLVVLGEFNICAGDSQGGAAQDFVISIDNHGLFQIISVPTHQAGYMLGWVAVWF